MPISRRPELALLLTVVIWGLNFPIIKVALEPMPPFVVNALRFILSVVVLGAMHAASGRDFWAPVRRYPGLIILLGFLGYIAYQLCFIIGVDLTTAGNAALIMASAPVWTALGSRLLGLEELPLAAWTGLAMGLAGTALVVVGGDGTLDVSADTFGGNLLMLLGAALWAAYTVLSRPLMDRGVSATGLAFFGMLVSMPVLLGLGVTAWPEVDWDGVTWHTWAALVFSGGLSTGAAYAWWNAAVRAIGPSHTAMANNLVPVIALIAGAALLGESIRTIQIVGGAAIIAGLVLMRRARLAGLRAQPPAGPAR
jgi:drug/metabolite transporter (DMT)-like permease